MSSIILLVRSNYPEAVWPLVTDNSDSNGSKKARITDMQQPQLKLTS